MVRLVCVCWHTLGCSVRLKRIESRSLGQLPSTIHLSIKSQTFRCAVILIALLSVRSGLAIAIAIPTPALALDLPTGFLAPRAPTIRDVVLE